MTPLRLPVSVAIFMLLAGGCGREPVGARDRHGVLVLQFEFQESTPGSSSEMSPSKLDIDSLALAISGSGMDTIERILPVEDGVADGVIEGIPAGSNRAVHALASSYDPPVDLYEGRDTVTIEAGRVTETTLSMIRLRDDIVAHLLLMPESTFVGMPVIADASSSFDYYFPDSLLWYRFLLDGVESSGWGHIAIDTLCSTAKGIRTVSVEVRNSA